MLGEYLKQQYDAKSHVLKSHMKNIKIKNGSISAFSE